MKHILLPYLCIAFLAIENEGHRDDFIGGFIENSQFNVQQRNRGGLNQSPSRVVPQYRPIIAAYHPRVNNRNQFFSRNADHLLDELDQPLKEDQSGHPQFEEVLQPATPPPLPPIPQPVAPLRSSVNEFYNTYQGQRLQAQRHQPQHRQNVQQISPPPPPPPPPTPTQVAAPPPQNSVYSRGLSQRNNNQRLNPFQVQYLNTFNIASQSVATTTSTTTTPRPTTTSTIKTTTTAPTTSTTTTTAPAPLVEDYDDHYYDNPPVAIPTTTTTTTTARSNFRPRPVSIRPFGSARTFRNAASAAQRASANNDNYELANNPDAGSNVISDQSLHKTVAPPHQPPKGRGGRGGGRQRKRQRTTTSTTTTTEAPDNGDDDYYEYDQDYDDDYDYQATTTTTTQRPRRGGGNHRRGGGRRRNNRRRQRPTEAPTTTTTTTLSPNYKHRPDGRIIDYNADPNFPYELKGTDLTEYPFYITIPESNFSCKGRHDGYYADIDAHCQVYHHCATGHQRYDFLCPNYTLFDQTTFTCRFINTVDCVKSENHYNRNNELYVTTVSPLQMLDLRYPQPIVPIQSDEKAKTATLNSPKASASNLSPSVVSKNDDDYHHHYDMHHKLDDGHHHHYPHHYHKDEEEDKGGGGDGNETLS